MPLSTFSLRRPLTSYAKVQAWVARLIRNRRFQLRRPRVLASAYLDVGCGPNTHMEFINLDYLWHPGVDVCWDLGTGLPFADGSLRGVFSEHCLEHFPLPEAARLLREMRRVLAPGGTVRLVVPDGELYLRTYVSQLDGDPAPRFPYEESERTHAGWTPIVSVNRIFYQDRESLFGHRTIYDFQLMEHLLRAAGFDQVIRRRFGAGADPRLLIDTPARQCESLYVEASVGPAAS
jgi:predicted SAM-dependent methyltransferase